MTIALKFDTPADEYTYEQKRFHSHDLLVDVALAERGLTGTMRNAVEQRRQRLDARERAMLAARHVRVAPAPLRHVGAEALLQFVERARQRKVGELRAGLGHIARGLVVAPPGVVAFEHAFQGIAKTARAEDAFVELGAAKLVDKDGTRQLPRPGREDQRRTGITAHAAVEGGDGAARRGPERVS